jgi:dTDP-4-dehydrorhamnose reductase
MANILVTGSNGQLGSELRKLSEKSGHKFIFTDIEELDLTDNLEIERFFENKDISFCINCAAYTAVDKAETEIENAFAVNVTAVRNLAEVCAENDTVFIHISTDFVFDGRNCQPYVESDKAKPINVYGQSKYEGEHQALKLNARTIIIRTSWLYSSFGNNFVKTMLRAGRKNDTLNVIFDQAGTPTFAFDLAEAILKIVDKVQTKEKDKSDFFGIFHYSNEGIASWYDFAIEIFSISGINCMVNPILTRDYPTPSKRPPFSVLDKSKIKMTYGFNIPYWKDSLNNCIKEILGNLENNS